MARAVRRAQAVEAAPGGFGVAARSACAISAHTRGVRILAAVLAHARRVGLDVAGARLGECASGGSSRRSRPAGSSMQLRVHRRAAPASHGSASRGAREHRPGLRDQVDAAFLVERRAERRAVVEEGAPEPGAVPAGAVQRSDASRARAACQRCARAPVAARLGERREALDHAAQEPGEPDRFAAAFVADAVHAVVPVAGAHQRQAVRADRAGCGRSCARSARTRVAVCAAGLRRVVGVLGAVGDRRRLR